MQTAYVLISATNPPNIGSTWETKANQVLTLNLRLLAHSPGDLPTQFMNDLLFLKIIQTRITSRHVPHRMRLRHREGPITGRCIKAIVASEALTETKICKGGTLFKHDEADVSDPKFKWRGNDACWDKLFQSCIESNQI